MNDEHASPDGFDDLMADINQPLAIVTTASGGVRAGCVVGFHAQCAIDPPEYAVWLSKANHTYRVGALGEYFAVHFLTRDDHDLADLFGGRSQEDTDKFARCSWSSGPDGVPLLERVPNRFVGRRHAWLDPGADHTCLVLRPVSAERAGAGAVWLRLADATDIDAGHKAEERQR